MIENLLEVCPGSLTKGFSSYCPSVLRRMFNGKMVPHILPSSADLQLNFKEDDSFLNDQNRISISGVQEKFSMILDGGQLRFTQNAEQGDYILKPVPSFGKNKEYIPANEHLTMQIAKRVFKIKTAENVLIFFRNGSPAYLTKRFDLKSDGSKLAVEDFASLMQKTPAKDGAHYKYQGNYLDLFEVINKKVASTIIESTRLLNIILFNYLFSNGDAHLKNFSLIETQNGDFKLSPAYDLLTSRIHIEDTDFALNDGLLPPALAQGKIGNQFRRLGKEAGILEIQVEKIIMEFLSKESEVEQLIRLSFLSDKLKRNYLQSFQGRLKQLKK